MKSVTEISVVVYIVLPALWLLSQEDWSYQPGDNHLVQKEIYLIFFL